VLIEGESGTGKELVAAAVHRRSGRTGKLVPVNCAALPPDLVESELFGHVRGAFSGALGDTSGLFREADGGTIFLDEIGELPAHLQPKLLRVLQEMEVRPVGSSKTFRVDVRVVAATNRPLQEAVDAGRLRLDLYYRLDVVRIVVPPLRERREDIPVLAAQFVRELNHRFHRQVAGISRAAMQALVAYDFPGNVRELMNLLERAYALGARQEIGLADLPGCSVPSASRSGAAAPAAEPAGEVESLDRAMARAEREIIARALRAHPDREAAARALGLSARTLYRRLREHGLQ